jgi:hypothetical protein
MKRQRDILAAFGLGQDVQTKVPMRPRIIRWIA